MEQKRAVMTRLAATGIRGSNPRSSGCLRMAFRRGLVNARGRGVAADMPQNSNRLDAHQRAEIAKWWPIIKAAEIKVE